MEGKMYHKVIIVGNLGRDPEMRYTPGGQAVTSFSVAVDDSYTSKSGDRVKRTIWIRVSTWGKLAETCNNYLQKGRKVLVEGTLVADPNTGNPRVYTRQDGSTGSSFEVNANTVRFLSSKGEDGGSEAAEDSDLGEGLDDEEIPF